MSENVERICTEGQREAVLELGEREEEVVCNEAADCCLSIPLTDLL